MQKEFTIIKLNRIIKNKKGDYSMSLRVRDVNNHTFHNGSMYIPQSKTSLLNFVHSLKQGDHVILTHEFAKNDKYPTNLDIKHIARL